MTDYSVELQQVESEIKKLKNDADYMSLVQKERNFLLGRGESLTKGEKTCYDEFKADLARLEKNKDNYTKLILHQGKLLIWS
jgi:hypothetical protein